MKNIHKINDNIYITSDEKIKEGDWVYTSNKTIMLVTVKYSTESSFMIGNNNNEKSPYYIEFCKKIILTTDKDLIKDGVQPISNEFLEWFVQNPSCEEVEIESWQTKGEWDLDYKIIIPKEETTAYHYLSCCRSIEECHCGKYPKQELERGITITHVGKEETLEEFAKEHYSYEYDEDTSITDNKRDAFIEGVKSDAAKDYWYAKWQSERMYSEEEAFNLCREFAIFVQHNGPSYKKQQEWFEQFKKK